MQAFELAFLADDWSVLNDLFAPDAVYEPVDAGAFGGSGSGREAAIAALRASTSGIDRRFDARIPEVLEGPLTRPDGTIFMRYRLTLRRAGVPDFVSHGDHVTTYADGRIARIVDTPDAGSGARLAEYLQQHRCQTRPAGAPLATDVDPRDARDLDAALSRSIARAYGYAKSEQDVGCRARRVQPGPCSTRRRSASPGGPRRGRAAARDVLRDVSDYRFEGEGCAAEDGAVAFWGRVRMTFAARSSASRRPAKRSTCPRCRCSNQQAPRFRVGDLLHRPRDAGGQMGVPVDAMRAQLALLQPAEPVALAAAGGAR